MGSLYPSLESGFLCLWAAVRYTWIWMLFVGSLQSAFRYLSLPESGGKDKTMDIKKNQKTVTTVTTTITTEVTAAPAGNAVITPAATATTASTASTASTEATTSTASTAPSADNGTPIDRSNEKLIDNTTTFNALLRILAMNPDVLTNAKAEAEEREAEEKEEKLRAALGTDYDLVFDKKAKEKANSTVGNNKTRRPGAIQLRTKVPRVAAIEIGTNGLCEVFNNGYAVYDNGNRKVVIWVPDCGTAKYYFVTETDEITSDVMGEFPWYNAVLIAGEDRIQYNMDHPKSQASASDADFDDAPPATSWAGATRFPNPEQAYLEKEAAEERRKALTEKQRRAYVMKYEEGMSLEEIGEVEGISFGTVRDRLDCARKKFATDLEKFFS